MNNKPWIVKKRSGEIWGRIRRVIIDPATRQIVSVDVVLDDTGRLVRVPWVSFEMKNEDIMLRTSDGEVNTTVMGASGAGLPDTVTLEVSAPRAFHT